MPSMPTCSTARADIDLNETRRPVGPPSASESINSKTGGARIPAPTPHAGEARVIISAHKSLTADNRDALLTFL